MKFLVDEKNVGVIKMEVTRNLEPNDNFLHKVRKLANDNDIILIFLMNALQDLEKQMEDYINFME